MTPFRRVLVALTSGMLGYGAFLLAGWTGWGIFMVAMVYGLIMGASS